MDHDLKSLLQIVTYTFHYIGLKVNYNKSSKIVIKSGGLISEETISYANKIDLINKEDCMKYLGVAFSNKSFKFNGILEKLSSNL